ncbi:MAG: BtpA/SgcQ family protein [Erysipelotrichaceae bacterium]|jgi:membrane complex biogenesis BtpA family protein|nr:BtpA/SgcQ family protein [Erysipelotrichaceae bacterium]
MSWLKEVIGTEKAIIAMCHLQALPGDSGYDVSKGMKHVVEAAKQDLLALQEGGVDAVMFSNEFSLPYLTDVRKETLAAMGRVIGELLPLIKVPFGVNVLWDGKASLDLAAATGALFVREIFSGVYGSDFGLWNTNFGETVRHQKEIDAQHVKLLFNIYPEASAYLGARSIEDIAKTTVFNCKPDALCVSGLTAGAPTDTSLLKKAKEAVGDTVVFANTGSRENTIEHILSIADGAVVGTTFKRDGVFENEVDVNRVKSFMKIVKEFRQKAGY